MRVLSVICHNIDFLGALRGVTHCPVNTSIGRDDIYKYMQMGTKGKKFELFYRCVGS